jgi:hypothetical protein
MCFGSTLLSDWVLADLHLSGISGLTFVFVWASLQHIRRPIRKQGSADRAGEIQQ